VQDVGYNKAARVELLRPARGESLRTVLKGLTACTLGLATVYFIRCYITLTGLWIRLEAYAAGTEKMPFQGRMLMMWPMRWAERNAALSRFASHHEGAFRTPDLIVIAVIGLLAIAATGWFLSRMYEKASQHRLFPWMPYTLLLVIAFVQYILHSEQNFLYPYDLLSLLFFTAGLYLIYSRNFWPLLLMFPVAALNRETIIFLVPLFFLDACCEDDKLEWRRLLRPLVLFKGVLLSGAWLAIQLYARHRFRGNEADIGIHASVNLTYLTHPQYWPQLLSIGAFLPLFVLYFWRRIPDFRLRMYCWIFPVWLGVMCFYGMLVETRIFGELGGLLALVSTLIFEQVVWSMVNERLALRAVK
jgi:hypothetical protein